MNAHLDLQRIEVARVHAQVNQVARSLVTLSDEEDTVSTIINNSIYMIFKDRGSSSLQLALSENYSINTRLSYLKDNLTYLTNIEKYILERMA